MTNSILKPTFALRKKNASDQYGRVCAFINYTSGGKSKTICFTMKDLVTGKPFRIPVKVWDKEKNKCLIRGTPQEKEQLIRINDQITEIILVVQRIVEDCHIKRCGISSSILSEDRIYAKIKQFESFTEPSEPDKSDYLVTYWENFIKRAEAKEVVIRLGRPYKKTAIISYKKCLNAFYTFEKDQGHHYTFDEIDLGFYDMYVAYMIAHGKMPNTIGERIKNLKALMHRSYKEGLHTNLAFHSFTKPEQEVDNVYLSESELDTLYCHDYRIQNPLLEKYRDLFLVGCYTGLRWEDYKSIQKDNFTTSPKGNPVLVVRAAKTGIRVVIPIIWKHLKDILEKYDYELPKVSEQKFNKYIKEACRVAGINAPVVITSGKNKRSEPYEKWELVSSHTARRSACTNMHLRGIPSLSIMKISGHTKESTFKKYIKVTAEENADYIAENYADKES